MDVEWTGLIVSLAPQITLGDGPGRVFLRQLVDARDDRVGVDGRVLPPSRVGSAVAIGMAAEAVWPPGSKDSRALGTTSRPGGRRQSALWETQGEAVRGGETHKGRQ